MVSEWQQVIGHDWAVEVLSGAIKYNRVGHAYLITGPAQVGKMTLAKIFAQALNCEADSAEMRPCGRCRQCMLMKAGRHPDLRYVEPEVSARGKASIKIDTIRELQRGLQLAAYEGRYKVVIIRGFDAANRNAANAFLKTLEEPPSNTILILTATDADSLLDTIKSRCRVVSIRPIPTNTIEQSLITRWNASQANAMLLANLSNGRLGWAVAATQDPAILEARNEQIGLLRELLGSSLVARFKLADRLARKAEALPLTLNLWLGWWRDLFLVNSGSGLISNVDERALFEQFSAEWEATAIHDSLSHTKQALWKLEKNANARLVLESLFLIYPDAP
ncbi:MAG: DNA polymerase III subunit delta' [Candidatus Promineifilaceae bacterium]